MLVRTNQYIMYFFLFVHACKTGHNARIGNDLFHEVIYYKWYACDSYSVQCVVCTKAYDCELTKINESCN